MSHHAAGEAAIWLCAQEENERFGEHPASLSRQSFVKFKCSLRGVKEGPPGLGPVSRALRRRAGARAREQTREPSTGVTVGGDGSKRGHSALR